MKNFTAYIASLILLATPAFAGTSSTPSPASITRVFTSSTTDVVPGWATGVYITEQGGGAGGAGGTPGSVGGASGAAWVDVFEPVTPGSTLTITVGAGGAANANGGNTFVTGTLTATPPVAQGGSTSPSNVASPQFFRDGTSISAMSNSATGTALLASNFIAPQIGAAGANRACFLFDATIAVDSNNGSGACSRFGKGGAHNEAGAGAAGTGFGAGGGGGSTTGGAGSSGFVMLRYVQ